MTKITIGIPTNRQGMRPKMVQCLSDMIAHGGYNFHIVIAEEGYTIAENRNYLAVQAIKAGSDYLFMADDDMTFPPDVLDTLISNDKDIVGAAYHPRSETGQIIKYVTEVDSIVLEDNEDPKYKSTFEVHATGTGIILIKTEVFSKVPRPWFMFEYYETGQCKLGEDWFFCREAKKAGYKVYTDPIIKVGHLGEKQY